VVPVRLDSCRMPVFLRDKLYADFRGSYDEALTSLLKRFEAVQA
jgi:hypothetical protein